MKKIVAVVLMLCVLCMGFAFAEESMTVADMATVTAVAEDGTAVIAITEDDVTEVVETLAAVENLTEYMGIEVEDRAVVEVVPFVILEEGNDEIEATWTFATELTENAMAVIGLETAGEYTWVEVESTVADGMMTIVLSSELIDMIKAADSAVLVILQ